MMSALQDEVQLLRESMSNIECRAAMQRVFYKGDLEGHQVVLVGSGVGKVRASACAQFLIDTFKATSMVIFGLAGALDKGLNIGDVIVSKQAIIYDYVVAGQGVNEDIMIPPIQADSRLVRLAMGAKAAIGPANSIYLGTVLTGDEAIADPAKRAELRKTFDGLCVEMEGGAAAMVCSMNSVPFVIVRGISDFADERAHFEFANQFQQALATSVKVVMTMLRRMADKEQTCDSDNARLLHPTLRGAD